MKKYVFLLLALLTVLCLSACGNKKPASTETEPQKQEIVVPTQFVPQMTYEIVLPPDTFGDTP